MMCSLGPPIRPIHTYVATRRPLELEEKIDDDGEKACIPPYLLPPIRTLLLSPTSSTPSSHLPPVAVLHRALVGLAIPLMGANVSLSGLESPLQYTCHVRHLAHMAPSDDDDGPQLREWMRHVEAWGGGVVTQATRVIVQGQTCAVVDPTLRAWERAAAAAAFGARQTKEEEGAIFGGLLEQLCLRLKLGTNSSSRHRSSDGCHAVVVVEGGPGSGKTSLVGAAARRLGLPAVLLRPGELMARHDVEVDAAVAVAAAAAVLAGRGPIPASASCSWWQTATAARGRRRRC